MTRGYCVYCGNPTDWPNDSVCADCTVEGRYTPTAKEQTK